MSVIETPKMNPDLVVRYLRKNSQQDTGQRVNDILKNLNEMYAAVDRS